MNVGTDCGLTIAGFYYVCFSCSDGSISGFYYDPNSRYSFPSLSSKSGKQNFLFLMEICIFSYGNFDICSSSFLLATPNQ